MMRSFFDGKFRYSVILAVPAWAMIASTPTARTPSLLNKSYAARPTRSRPVLRGAGEAGADPGASDVVMAALRRLPPKYTVGAASTLQACRRAGQRLIATRARASA